MQDLLLIERNGITKSATIEALKGIMKGDQGIPGKDGLPGRDGVDGKDGGGAIIPEAEFTVVNHMGGIVKNIMTRTDTLESMVTTMLNSLLSMGIQVL